MVLLAAFAITVVSDAPPGKPVWTDATLTANLDPDSVRIRDDRNARIAAKVEWSSPKARMRASSGWRGGEPRPAWSTRTVYCGYLEANR